MITIPYGSDTAIYYWPYATIALIVANVIAFPIQMAIPEASFDDDIAIDHADNQPLDLDDMIREMSIANEPPWARFALSHGEGIQPIQWFTSLFMHAGAIHLVVNMIFLWAFGLIFEGKVGPFIMPIVYVSIGVAKNALEQSLFLGASYSYSLGSSSAIYGVLACCMLLAPKDNLMCLTWVFRWIFFFAIPILIFGLFYVLWDFGASLFSGFGISIPLLNVMGAGVGFVFGVALLNSGFAKTDNEDLFALFYELFTGKKRKKKLTRREKDERALQREQKQLEHVESVKVAWRSFDTHFAAGNIDAAINVFLHLKRKDPSQAWQEGRLLKVIQHFASQKDWDKVCYYSGEYLNSFDSRGNDIRLNLAKIYLGKKELPRKAITVLQELDVSKLDAKSNELAKSLANKAKKMIASGTIEFSDD